MMNRLILAALALTIALLPAAPAHAYWGPHYGVSLNYYGGYGYPYPYPYPYPAYAYAPPPTNAVPAPAATNAPAAK